MICWWVSDDRVTRDDGVSKRMVCWAAGGEAVCWEREGGRERGDIEDECWREGD